MTLEILAAGSPSDRPPLLFVHGSFCAAWVWSEYFLPYFAERGWHCAAVSLRGHGGSAGYGQLDSFGLADYVADVQETARRLGRRPVVVGHSLGGMVAQHYVRQHGAAGLVMLASVGPGGLGNSQAHITMCAPDLLWQLNCLQTMGLADYDVLRRRLFSAGFPADRARRYIPLFQPESQRASYELLFPQWLHLWGPPAVPALVVGGAGDPFIPHSDLLACANLWNAELQVIDVPHVMMLDLTWRKTADTMNAWLAAKFPAASLSLCSA